MELHERLNALIHPSRTRIMQLLCSEELTGGEVARVIQGAQSTTSRHLKVLSESGWVVSRRAGNSVIFGSSDQLDEPSRALWNALSTELETRWPDDRLRLEETLRARAQSSRDYFGRIGARWEEVRRDLYGESSLTHLAFAMIEHEQTVADLGCGSGGVLRSLAPQVKKVIGIDREPSMLEAAQQVTADFEHVEVRAGELEAPPLQPEEVDVALLNLVLHLVESPSSVLEALRPALSAKGKIVMIDMVEHHREEYRQTMGHIWLGFSEEQLNEFANRASLRVLSYRILPPDLDAAGPALFVATLSK